MLLLQYILSNYIRKITQTRRGDSAQLRTLYDNIMSQNAPDCISLHIYFRNIFGGRGGACPQNPQEACGVPTQDFSPKQKNEKS